MFGAVSASLGSAWAFPFAGTGISTRLSIDYACRPRLDSRLTWAGLAWPEPLVFRRGESHSLSLLMPAFSLAWRPRLDHSAATTATTLPTHPHTWPARGAADRLLRECHGFGGV